MKWNELLLIVPVFNTPSRYLKQCLGSILNQTTLPGRTLIVDDYTDNIHTLKAIEQIIEVYGDELDIKMVRPDKMTIGPGNAFNYGINYAVKYGYKFCKLLGSDDWLDDTFIETMRKAYDNRLTHIHTCLERGDLEPGKKDLPFGGVKCNHMIYYQHRTKKNRLHRQDKSTCHPIFLTEEISKYKFPVDKPRAVDGELLTKFDKDHILITITGFYGEYYRMHKSNISHNKDGTWKGEPDVRNNNEIDVGGSSDRRGNARNIRDGFRDRRRKRPIPEVNRSSKGDTGEPGTDNGEDE